MSNDCIDVWRTSLDLSPPQIKTCLSLLSREERKQVELYRSVKRRNEFIIGHGLLRKIISQTLGIDPSGFEIAHGEKNKPYLPPGSFDLPVSFNISHSHEEIVVALGLNRSIGIDIEYIRYDVDFIKLARRFFSAAEIRELEQYQVSDLPRAFFSCWSRKEAFVKALGDGISFGLGEFSVSTGPVQDQVDLVTAYNPGDAKNWHIVNIPAGERYVIALCAGGNSDYQTRLWQP